MVCPSNIFLAFESQWLCKSCIMIFPNQVSIANSKNDLVNAFPYQIHSGSNP